MTGAIFITVARDALGEDLDLAAWRRQRLALGIFAEGAQHAAVMRLLRKPPLAALPERVEVRSLQAAGCQRFLGPLVEVTQPVLGSTALGEFLAASKAFG